MKPIVLTVHERPVTHVRYNMEGDMLFTCGKDRVANAWYAEDGDRLGVFEGHKGVVWACLPSKDTKRLFTVSGDETCKVWDVQSGKELFSFTQETGMRCLDLSLGDRLLATCTDTSFGNKPSVNIHRVSEEILTESDLKMFSKPKDPEAKTPDFVTKDVCVMLGHTQKINSCVWGPLNRHIYTCADDKTIRVWDPEAGVEVQCVEVHDREVTSLKMGYKRGCLVSCSLDKTAKLFDSRSMEVINTFHFPAMINDVDISPIREHILMAGGQDAEQVAATAGSEGQFEAGFYHAVYGMELGRIGGHFSPINSLSFSPDGRSFATGAEEATVRIHHFDEDYFTQDTEA